MKTAHLVATTERTTWIKPAVRKIRAGDAENGPTPMRDDGTFSRGPS